MNAIVMKRRMFLGALLLLACSSVMMRAMVVAGGKDKPEKTFFQKLKKKVPSLSQAAWFCAGAAYPLWCVTHDSATLGQYSKMSLRRGLWSYGVPCTLCFIARVIFGDEPSFGERLQGSFGSLPGFLKLPDNHYWLFAPAASRGIFFRGESFVMQFVIPLIYQQKNSSMKCNTSRCIVFKNNKTNTQRGVEVYEIYAFNYGRKNGNWQLFTQLLQHTANSRNNSP